MKRKKSKFLTSLIVNTEIFQSNACSFCTYIYIYIIVINAYIFTRHSQCVSIILIVSFGISRIKEKEKTRMYHQPYSINCRKKKNLFNPYSPKEMCFENPSLYFVCQDLNILYVQKVLTHVVVIVSYHIKWVMTSWSDSIPYVYTCTVSILEI